MYIVIVFCLVQVKELLKREVEKGDIETQSKSAIIADYKNICSQLSERLDKEQAANAKTINMYKVSTSVSSVRPVHCAIFQTLYCFDTIQRYLSDPNALLISFNYSGTQVTQCFLLLAISFQTKH